MITRSGVIWLPAMPVLRNWAIESTGDGINSSSRRAGEARKGHLHCGIGSGSSELRRRVELVHGLRSPHHVAT
jgi:hypothetical protein